MRRTISALSTVGASALLALVTVYLPQLPLVTTPLVMSAFVIVFALAWPRIVTPTPRWTVSIALAVTGLLSVWVLSLLPAGTQFAESTNDLWLAPVGGAIALGVLWIFVVQTFTLPGGVRRFLTTTVLGIGAVITAAAAGWTLLLRHKYEVAVGSLGVERITGVTWLMLTILAALSIAALATLLPARRRTRMIITVIVATSLAIGLQLVRTGPLSVPAVIASAITGLIVALIDSFSNTTETSHESLNHPMTAVAVGSGTVIVTGMVSYFVIHVLPW